MKPLTKESEYLFVKFFMYNRGSGFVTLTVPLFFFVAYRFTGSAFAVRYDFNFISKTATDDGETYKNTIFISCFQPGKETVSEQDR